VRQDSAFAIGEQPRISFVIGLALDGFAVSLTEEMLRHEP